MNTYSSSRVVRVQAGKTLETYLQRIKTLTANYPDTVTQSPTTASAETVALRMGTTQTDDSSWAGWGISSFTKKLGAASGEIERAQSPVVIGEGRSALVPAMSSSRPNALVQSKTASASFSRTTVISPPPSAPSFLGDADNEDNDPEAWGDLDEDNFFDAPEPEKSKSSTPNTTTKFTCDYDDTEPDISAMMSKSKAPLPKGLVKKKPATTTAAPLIGLGSAFSNKKGNVTATRQSVKTAGPMKSIIGGAVVKKKTETKKLEDPWGNGDDDWGGAWDK